MSTRPASPLILNSTITGIKPGERRSVQDVGKVGLANPTRNPILVDEIKFYTVSAGQITGRGNNYQMAFQAEVRVGRFQITQQPVPFAVLGRPLDGGAFDASIETKTVTWRLPKPLYLAPEEYLDVSVYFDNSFVLLKPTYFPTSANIDITASCRVLDLSKPVPKRVPVPYVCGWASNILAGGTDQLNITAPIHTFRNAYGSPLYVKRFLGQHLYFDNANGGGVLTSPVNVADDVLFARLSCSDGKIVARDFVPWSFLFSILDYSFDVNAMLPPGGFYQLQAQAKLRSANASDRCQLYMGMVGYHMVDLIDGVLHHP